MLIDHSDRARCDALAKRLRAVESVSAGLFAQVIDASPRLMTLNAMGKTGRLDRLISCQAWTEAAIELVALEVPGRQIKRLCLDDGEWICTLTRFPDLPDWLDDSSEGRHRALPIAILRALLDLREQRATDHQPASRLPSRVSAGLADIR